MEMLSKVALKDASLRSFELFLGLRSSLTSTMRSLFDGVLTNTFLITVLFIVLAVIVGALIFVAVSAQGAIIAAAGNRSIRRRVGLAHVWHVGTHHAATLFVINLCKRLIIVFLSIGVGAAMIRLVAGSPSERSLFVLLFLASLFVGAVVSFVALYAAAYAVLEEASIGQSIRRGIQLFVEHPVVSLEVAGIILILNIVVTLIAVIGLFAVFFPLVMFMFWGIVLGGSVLSLTLFLLGTMLYTAFLVLLGSVFSVFHIAVWTDLFLHMHRSGLKSRLLHLLKNR